MKNRILFITSSWGSDNETTSDSIIKRLNEFNLSCDIFKLDTTDKPGGDIIVIEKKDDKLITKIRIDNIWHSPDEYCFGYWFHPQISDAIINNPSIEVINYIKQQFKSTLEYLHFGNTTIDWFNNPIKADVAENKIIQMQHANECGLTIPDTLITNHPAHLTHFYKNQKNIIVKSLAVSLIKYRALFTSKVTPKDLKRVESLRICPSIFQRNVKKKYDIRVIIVGTKIFAARIMSQHDPSTIIDWRSKNYDKSHKLRIKKTTLPKAVNDKLLNFMGKIGLHYGAIDLIETHDGEYIFLEVNPYGQWIFVEEATKQPISQTIANSIYDRIQKHINQRADTYINKSTI